MVEDEREAAQAGQQVDLPGGHDSAQRHRREGAGEHHGRGLGADDRPARVEPVDEHAADEAEHCGRQELAEHEHAHGDRGVRELED